MNINSFPAKKRAGVSLHITSLPGPFGIGELGLNAFRFVDKLAAMGIGVWQFLPTGPTAYGDSPYQPLSTFAGNENLIDIQDLIELALIETSEALIQPHINIQAPTIIRVARVHWRILGKE